jgi:hypothetical protein
MKLGSKLVAGDHGCVALKKNITTETQRTQREQEQKSPCSLCLCGTKKYSDVDLDRIWHSKLGSKLVRGERGCWWQKRFL